MRLWESIYLFIQLQMLFANGAKNVYYTFVFLSLSISLPVVVHVQFVSV